MQSGASGPTAAVGEVVEAASEAFDSWGTSTLDERATALRAVAAALDASADELVPLAGAETHLGLDRLRGELRRTTFQLRFFADEVRTGRHLEATIDHADEHWGMGPRPDLRCVAAPLGPVLVFAASNFPFAFSVAGGDTASALAAGCPVVVKAHEGHLELSRATARVVRDALAGVGAPPGLFDLVVGVEAGRDALVDPRVKAAAFTGSIAGGRALFDLAMARPEPIPFFGEMGSVNPTFVTRAAAAARAEQIVAGFLDSFTKGAGQFCTKPGILLVPTGSQLTERLAAALSARLSVPAAPLLNQRIHDGFVRGLAALQAREGIRALVIGDDALADPPTPTLLLTTIERILAAPDEVITEVFGPTALVVEYERESQLLDLARLLPGQLSASIHGVDDDPIAPQLIQLLAQRAGRVLWGQWPTGVSVTYAQQHGGPYPATTAASTTSVGAAAIRRFLRPVAYQGVPDLLLPPSLQEANPLGVPRRVDGNSAG
ncbi:MAG TPA: aldehyde dehydrogenase (NADP(+)) [Actinomycetes bacterium]|nr:aldehyde dehydrogenase (NADP(+)) [Actinomycetes bacterium]